MYPCNPYSQRACQEAAVNDGYPIAESRGGPFLPVPWQLVFSSALMWSDPHAIIFRRGANLVLDDFKPASTQRKKVP
eukprot:7530057-Pyramimonas_sp.AAC.1